MAQNTRTCPICGQPTSQYMGKFRKDGLCPHHATLLRNGEIVQCDVCGNWHNSNENCTCNNGENTKTFRLKDLIRVSFVEQRQTATHFVSIAGKSFQETRC